MNKFKRILTAALSAVFASSALALTACGTNDTTYTPIDGEKFTMSDITDYKTYDNADFSDYSEEGVKETENLPAQWDMYGAGDPYVFRYNGMYYLYVSTQDGQTGVRAWKSRDMISWEQCTGTGLATGYVSDDAVTTTAYAPEVYHFNGKFYMYTSPGGNGHYTLISDSPEGPFVCASDNYGMSIDGSVFMDDDESLYFLNAGTGGIFIRSMENYAAQPGRAIQLKTTNLGWTEGPMLIKKDGYYYLTYTGIHVTSPAYRVSYAVERDGNKINKADSFNEGASNPILLEVDTQNNFKGLGHSSTVLGPDMDSYYIVYHSLNSLTAHGPWRSMNIDRLTFNGAQMSVSASKTDSIAANLPAFYAENTTGDKFETSGNKTLSVQSTGSVFTSEYNFTGNGVKCIAGYTDDNNYVYVTADYSAKNIKLVNVSGGTETEIASGTLKNEFDPGVLHTVRIAYADGKCDVYFDNLRKIADASVTMTAGKIGYEGGAAQYTAFSNVARGYSDRIELKQSDSAIGAANYLPQNAYDGVNSYKLGSGSGVGVVDVDKENYPDSVSYDGAYKMTFANKGDYASYSMYFREAGHYGIAMTYETKYAGRTVGLQLNGGDVQTVTLPSVTLDEDDYLSSVVTAHLAAEFDVKKGVNIITVYGGDSEVAFISFTTAKKAYGDWKFENDLKEVIDTGVNYTAMFRITSDGHTTRSGNRMLANFGDGSIANCEIEVEMKFLSNNIYSAGVILRSNRYATSNYDDNSSIQGYYIGLNDSNVFLSRYYFNYTRSNVRFTSHGHRSDSLSHWFKLKIRMEGNTVSVSLDGKSVFTFTDPQPFLNGYVGLYSEGAEVAYRNLTIKGI